jgi:hypothetical protein
MVSEGDYGFPPTLCNPRNPPKLALTAVFGSDVIAADSLRSIWDLKIFRFEFSVADKIGRGNFRGRETAKILPIYVGLGGTPSCAER